MCQLPGNRHKDDRVRSIKVQLAIMKNLFPSHQCPTQMSDRPSDARVMYEEEEVDHMWNRSVTGFHTGDGSVRWNGIYFSYQIEHRVRKNI